MSAYFDIHTHLTHEAFVSDRKEVIQRAEKGGLSAIVVNGLGPKSNREILQLAKDYPLIRAALGIYPVEAVNELLPEDYKFPVERFSVDGEIDFIAQKVREGAVDAIGECGLDGFHLEESTFAGQEKVFVKLIHLARENKLPIIVHTRKREERALAILAEHKATKVNLHCYSGKTKLAIDAAEKYGWCFSIPANLKRSHSFQTLVKKLPPECVLTETDAPYLAPEPGMRNEPAYVVSTVAEIAHLRQWTEVEAREQLWKNFERLMRKD